MLITIHGNVRVRFPPTPPSPSKALRGGGHFYVPSEINRGASLLFNRATGNRLTFYLRNYKHTALIYLFRTLIYVSKHPNQ